MINRDFDHPSFTGLAAMFWHRTNSIIAQYNPPSIILMFWAKPKLQPMLGHKTIPNKNHD
jgi:hypothetical protein